MVVQSRGARCAMDGRPSTTTSSGDGQCSERSKARCRCRGSAADRTGEAGLFALLVGPAEQGSDELQDLELLGVGAVEGQEVKEVICHDMSAAEAKRRRLVSGLNQASHPEIASRRAVRRSQGSTPSETCWM